MQRISMHKHGWELRGGRRKELLNRGPFSEFTKDWTSFSGWYQEQLKGWKATLARREADVRRIERFIGFDFVVQRRIKRARSMWEKMSRRGLTCDGVHDCLGLRILVETKPQCYGVLVALHNSWSGRIKRERDYIAYPKPNGYQSLHLCLSEDTSPDCEVQIRTWAMHDMCECGLAAHSTYKVVSLQLTPASVEE